MRNRPTRAFLTALLALSACQASDEPSPALPRFVDAALTTSAGTPIAGAYVTVQAWPESPNRPPAIDPLARTDGAGHFVVPIGTYRAGALDSVQIRWLPPGCFRAVRDTTVYALTLTQDTAALQLTDTTSGPPATSSPAEFCGFGVSGVGGPDAFRLGLRLDSVVGPQLFGRWRLNYTWTQGDDFGAFVGAQTPTTLQLVLTPTTTVGTCTGLRLGTSVSPSGAWGPLTPLDAQGCVAEPLRFDMVQGHWFQSYP